MDGVIGPPLAFVELVLLESPMPFELLRSEAELEGIALRVILINLEMDVGILLFH